MSDLFNSHTWNSFLPWASFIVGLSGSLHCVGMCGGLVASSSKNRSDIFAYQIGRLLGYLLLGLVAGLLGHSLKMALHNSYFTIVPSFMIGGLFIYWGIQGYFGIHVTYPGSKTLSKIYQVLWRKINAKAPWISKSFTTGLLSLFLPCGLLYGVVLGTLALQNLALSLLVVIFFWAGTLPAMMLAPNIIQGLLSPLKAKSPKFYALFLMLIGVATIMYRIYAQQDPHHHHH